MPGMLARNCWRVETSAPDIPLFSVLENLIETVFRELMACCMGVWVTVATALVVVTTGLYVSISPGT